MDHNLTLRFTCTETWMNRYKKYCDRWLVRRRLPSHRTDSNSVEVTWKRTTKHVRFMSWARLAGDRKNNWGIDYRGIPAQNVQELHPQKNFFLWFCSFLVRRYPLVRELLIPNFFALGPIFWFLRGFKVFKIWQNFGVCVYFNWLYFVSVWYYQYKFGT